MRRDLQQLVRDRARKAAEIDDCKAVLHPIRRLPREILCDIFLSFINENLEDDDEKEDDEEEEEEDDDNDDNDYNDYNEDGDEDEGEDLDLEDDEEEEEEERLAHPSSLNPLKMNWVVSRVSADWRVIALSFPRLWSTVRIVDDDLEPETKAAFRLHILAVQMDRAAHHKLSISIHYNSNVPLASSHPLLQILLSTSLRWRDLHLVMRLQNFAAFASLRGSLSSLETLHIWDKDSTPTDLTLSMFEFAPRLKTLWGHSNAISHFSLSLSQITTFHSTRGTPCHSYPQLLALMPNLKVLQTRCSNPDSEDTFHNYPIPLSVRLPHLERANFNLVDEDECHSSDDCVVLSRLSLPALQHLTVQLQSSTNELRGLLRRSGCSLKTMVLHTLDVSEEDCINLLLDVPTLESLTLDSDKLLDEFIQNPSIVPALQWLKVRKFYWDLDPEWITELEKSRPTLLVIETADMIYSYLPH